MQCEGGASVGEPTFARRLSAVARRAKVDSPTHPHATNQAHRRAHRRRRRTGAERRDPRRREIRLQWRHRGVGHRRQLRRPHRAWPHAGAGAEGRHRHSAPGRHDSRHDQSRQPVRVSRLDQRREGRLLGSRHRELPQVRPRRARRHRRGRHAGDRASASPRRAFRSSASRRPSTTTSSAPSAASASTPP